MESNTITITISLPKTFDVKNLKHKDLSHLIIGTTCAKCGDDINEYVISNGDGYNNHNDAYDNEHCNCCEVNWCKSCAEEVEEEHKDCYDDVKAHWGYGFICAECFPECYADWKDENTETESDEEEKEENDDKEE